MSILLETAAIFYRENVLHYYDVTHVPVSFDALPALTDAELSAVREEQKIARNVAAWLVGNFVRMMRRRYPTTWLHKTQDAVDLDEELPERWRASM